MEHANTVNHILEPINRGMWVWNTNLVVTEQGHGERIMTCAREVGLTDIYLYVAPTHYVQKQDSLRIFNAKATAAGVRVWGLDGARAYFSDADGPGELFSGIDNLIAFNLSAAENERFFGFQADNEPQDKRQYKAFHNDVPSSALNRTAGSGVWQMSQVWDREMLMRDWLHIHKAACHKLHAAGLRFGAAIPSWISTYQGEGLHVSFPTSESERRPVMEQMMRIVDDYMVMTYHTDPASAVNRARPHVQIASAMPVTHRPRVHASVEVTRGVGVKISYGDTPGKDSRCVVLQDIQLITDALKPLAGFNGVSIHQWSGWEALRP
ncbi:hypothetical protein MMC08_004505 [Hypocenomyce scalaris]|nr:hypothetical protein [Hypocenomyce scalaris]